MNGRGGTVIAAVYREAECVYSVNAVLIATGNTVTNSGMGVNQYAGTLLALHNNAVRGNYPNMSGTLTPASVD